MAENPYVLDILSQPASVRATLDQFDPVSLHCWQLMGAADPGKSSCSSKK
jgi:hypothetical protein